MRITDLQMESRWTGIIFWNIEMLQQALVRYDAGSSDKKFMEAMLNDTRYSLSRQLPFQQECGERPDKFNRNSVTVTIVQSQAGLCGPAYVLRIDADDPNVDAQLAKMVDADRALLRNDVLIGALPDNGNGRFEFDFSVIVQKLTAAGLDFKLNGVQLAEAIIAQADRGQIGDLSVTQVVRGLQVLIGIRFTSVGTSMDFMTREPLWAYDGTATVSGPMTHDPDQGWVVPQLVVSVKPPFAGPVIDSSIAQRIHALTETIVGAFNDE